MLHIINMETANIDIMTNEEFGEVCKRAAESVLSCWGETSLEQTSSAYYLTARHKWSPAYCDWRNMEYDVERALKKAGAVKTNVLRSSYNYMEVRFQKPKVKKTN